MAFWGVDPRNTTVFTDRSVHQPFEARPTGRWGFVRVSPGVKLERDVYLKWHGRHACNPTKAEAENALQGYLAHKKTPRLLRSPIGP